MLTKADNLNCNLWGVIRSISFDPLINIDAEGNIDFPMGKISIYQNDICFAIDMCMALDMRCGARKCLPRQSQITIFKCYTLAGEDTILPYIGANIYPTKNSPKPRFRGINLQISQ